MPSSSIPILTGTTLFFVTLIFILLFAYSAYRAFTIRKVLFVRLYRNQALWVGTYGVYWTLIFIALGILDELYFQNPVAVTNYPSLAFILFAGLYIGLILGFLWIDATMVVARRSDPLRRDTLRWTKLRFALWPAILVGMLVGLLFVGPRIIATSTGDPLAEITAFYEANSIVFILIAGTSVPALILAGLRTKDILLRKQVTALGLYVVVLLAQGLLSFLYTYNGSFNLVFAAVTTSVTLVNCLSLIRTSRILAPTTRLTRIIDDSLTRNA